MKRFRIPLFLLVLNGFIAVASAHKPSDSYLRIIDTEAQLRIEWDIALKDLEFVVGLDSNADGEITWGELKAKQGEVSAYALSRLRLSIDGQTADLELSKLLVTHHSDGCYAVLRLATADAIHSGELGIEYNLLFDVDPTHRGLVLYSHSDGTSTHVLSPTDSVAKLQRDGHGYWGTFVDYTREGVWHIWIGLDHILFLITLLLPAVYDRRSGENEPVTKFQPACASVLGIVTMFTLAHSITLWLAVMEYVTLPSQFVESTIAFSIIVTAVNNLYPILPLSNRMIAFGFGLVHGFGFANVLLDLGLSSLTLGISLLGFNVGVELGQLAIVVVFLPLAFAIRQTTFYEWGAFRFGSTVVAIIAALWMYERIFNADLLFF